MSEELKPCPFCGGKAAYNAFMVECPECDIRFEGDCPEDFNDVVAAWNRRAGDKT